MRANLLAGLAALGSSACAPSETSELLAELSAAERPSAVRVATARWLRAVARDLDDATRRALAECSGDPDPELARACAPAPAATQLPSAARGVLDIYAYASDESPLRERMVALRLPTGAVFVGRTDPNGHVLLPASAGDQVVLEDPADAELLPDRQKLSAAE